MGLIGKFVSRGWNGIKNGIGTAGKMIKSGANKAWNFIKENHEPIEKLAGTALTAGLLIKGGGEALPYILEGSNLIKSLPDNGWTKHLKNVAKGAVFDYGQYDNGQYSVHKDPEKKPEQTNAHTEYKSPPVMSNFMPRPPMSNFMITPSSAVSSPTTVVRRTNVRQKTRGKKKTNAKKILKELKRRYR